MKTRSQTGIESSNMISLGNAVECAICLQDVKYIVNTECKHPFCDSCLIQHLLRNQTCPLCRTICDPQFIINQIQDIRQTKLFKKLELKIYNSNLIDERVYTNRPIIPPNPFYLIIAETIAMAFFILEVSFIILSIYYTVIHVRQYIEGKPVYANSSIVDIEYPKVMPIFDIYTDDMIQSIKGSYIKGYSIE